jgi:hypothetical protein
MFQWERRGLEEEEEEEEEEIIYEYLSTFQFQGRFYGFYEQSTSGRGFSVSSCLISNPYSHITVP